MIFQINKKNGKAGEGLRGMLRRRSGGCFGRGIVNEECIRSGNCENEPPGAGRLRRRGGFTLAEMLVTVIIMSLAVAASVQGIVTAHKVYANVVSTSNSQLLMSTTLMELRNELGTAGGISISSDGTTITYKSAGTGNRSRISSGTDTGAIKIEEYINGSNAPEARHLVSEETAADGLTVEFGSVSYNSSSRVVTISDIKVMNGDSVIAERDKYLIQLMW